METDFESIRLKVIESLVECSELKAPAITGESALIGKHAIIDSQALVQLLLAMEDFAEESLGVRFDWTSDQAMSEARSVLRDVNSLANHLAILARSKSS